VVIINAGVAEWVDAQDLKSCGGKLPCRFESDPRHLKNSLVRSLVTRSKNCSASLTITLSATISYLTRCPLHRCLKRAGINRLPDTTGAHPKKQKCKPDPADYFHIDMTEVHTVAGKHGRIPPWQWRR
jgi:hypothetical protein